MSLRKQLTDREKGGGSLPLTGDGSDNKPLMLPCTEIKMSFYKHQRSLY